MDSELPELLISEIDETAFFRHRVHVQADILNQLPDGVIVVDERGRILMVNHALCLFSGYEEEELRFKSISALIPEQHRQKHADYIHHFCDHPQVPSRHMGEAQQLFPLLRKDGSTAPVDISISHVASHLGRLSVAIVRWALPR